MFKKAKVITGAIIAAGLAIGTVAAPAIAAESEDYSGKTVILYTGNLRGDVDIYAKIATAKKDYQSKGATVWLVDSGNYLQGSTYANSDRGLGIYNLMDAAGYDVAAMGMYEFVHADATTGMPYHNNLYRYYTQSELMNGCDELQYNVGYSSDQVNIRPAKAAAKFSVISSNVDIQGENSGYYSFRSTANRSNGTLNVGFMGITDNVVADRLQDGFLNGYEIKDTVEVPAGDIVVCLDNEDALHDVSDIEIKAPTDDNAICGAYVIDDATKEYTHENVNLDEYAADAAVAAVAQGIKDNAKAVFSTSDFTLVGADSICWVE